MSRILEPDYAADNVGPDTSLTPNAKGWRPPQWSSSPAYVITTPATTAAPSKMYVLTPLRVTHDQTIHRTEHPVQTGAAITDHAYAAPSKVHMELGVSDAMDLFSANMWGGSATSSSVNAFEALRNIARSRIVITLSTRLHVYTNMLVELVSAEETSKTIASGRFSISFSEIFIANTKVLSPSARPQDSVVFLKGTTTPLPTEEQVKKMFGVITTPSGQEITPYTGYVSTVSGLVGPGAIGAGDFTSVAGQFAGLQP